MTQYIYIFVREAQLLQLNDVEVPRLFAGLQSNYDGGTLIKMQSLIKSPEIKPFKIMMRFHQQLHFHDF